MAASIARRLLRSNVGDVVSDAFSGVLGVIRNGPECHVEADAMPGGLTPIGKYRAGDQALWSVAADRVPIAEVGVCVLGSSRPTVGNG